MPIFPVFPRALARRLFVDSPLQPEMARSDAMQDDVRRHFYNERSFQTFATFFRLWDGWATAGHCLTETNGLLPPFAEGEADSWPDGLDAALIGCRLPDAAPPAPEEGQRVVAMGYPAGSRHLETRNGAVYISRLPGQWIVKMDDADEPVVTGMSGGPVIDAATGEPLGILITRNSPADLDSDGDADESYDFTALADVWAALRPRPTV